MSAAADPGVSVRERFVVFDCDGEACIGVLSEPARAAGTAQLGVLIIVGGPQTRVGSHRQFVLLARALAGAGTPVLRCDVRGMGDSEGAARTFDSVDHDILAGMDALQRETGVCRIALWGLCDGATAAIMFARAEPRVAGIAALNPWVRSAQGEAAVRLKHYYLQRLTSREFWAKLFTGRLGIRQGVGDLAGAMQTATGNVADGVTSGWLRRVEAAWLQFERPLLVVLSGRDLTAREFEAWVAADRGRVARLRASNVELVTYPDADHTFSSRANRDAVCERTIEWIGRLRRQS